MPIDPTGPVVGDTTAPAYVLDLSPTGLAAVRVLAREGIAVRGFDANPEREGLRSRYGRPALCPDPVSDPEGLLAYLSTLAASERERPFLLPGNDKFALFVSAHRDRLARYFSFVLPPVEVFESLCRKERTYELAARLGIPVPYTRVVAVGQPHPGEALSGFPYPAVLKPSLSYTLWGRIRGKVLVARDEREARRVVAALPPGTVFVLQEVIPGPETSYLAYNTYRDRQGRVLGEFVNRKLRKLPPGFGNVALAEGCLDPEVLEAGRRLFDAVGFSGLGMVEFKRDQRDGRLKLIEVNPRLWLAHRMAARSGVDFVLLAYLDATGQAPRAQTRGPETVRWQHVGRDAAISSFLIRRGRLGWGEWLASLRGPRVPAVWDARDPGPSLQLLVTALRRIGGRFRGLRPRNGVPPSQSGTPDPPELPWDELLEVSDPGGKSRRRT